MVCLSTCYVSKDRLRRDGSGTVAVFAAPERATPVRQMCRPTIGPVAVDVSTDIEINRPRAQVASYACDPDNATAWYENITAVDWHTPRPVAAGSRIAFVARFLGRRLAYVYEVTTMIPGERFVMRTSEGPFPMETTYTWEDTPAGATHMTLRNQGEPSGFSKLAAPLMARAMRRANRHDLEKLKTLIETALP
jgi:uncharacterized membrane protein